MQRAGTNTAIKESGDAKDTKVEWSSNELKSKGEVVVRISAEPASSPASRDATPASFTSAINNAAFRAADPFDLHIRHLSLTVAQPTKPLLQKWASRLKRRVGKSCNVEEVRDTTDVENDSIHSHEDDLKKSSTQSQEKCPTARILSDISADIPSGSLTAILGSSGSGKTTLLNVLAGRLRSSNCRRDTTTLHCNDVDSSRQPKRHDNAGYVFRSRGGSALHLSGSKWFVASHACAGAGVGARISSAAKKSMPQPTNSSRSNQSSSLNEVVTAYVTQQDVLLPTLTVRETLRYAADLRLTDLCKKEKDEVVQQVILELGLKDAADTKIGSSTGNGCSGGEKRRTSIGVQV